MPDNAAISLRAYRAGDEDAIAELLRDNYPNTPDVATIRTMWMWQFRNELSRDSCVAVAEMNGRIVGHYAVMWLEMTCPGGRIQGAISTATVTDKSVRGRGVFVDLARKAYQNLAADGCSLVFGFPNAQSVHGFVTKLNWVQPGPFPVHLKPLRTRPFLARKLGDGAIAGLLGGAADAVLSVWSTLRSPAAPSGLAFEPVDAIPEEAAALWSSSFGSSRVALLRDKRYLDWRYLRKPGFAYRFVVARAAGKAVGYAIYCIERKLGVRMMYVMELVVGDDDAGVTAGLCRHLLDVARAESVDGISLLVLPGDPNAALFGRMGFIRVPRKLFPQDIYFGAMVNGSDVDLAVLRRDDQWYLSWGDLDVV